MGRHRAFSLGIIKSVRAKGLPDPLGREEASLPSLSPQRGRSYSGGGVSNPPGIALQRGQDGAPLLSRRVGNARSPLQLRGRWSNLD